MSTIKISQAASPPNLITLIVLTAFAPLTLNMFLPSLANIADDLNSDYATVSLAVAGYLAVSAVVYLVVGPLSDRIGRRPVLLVALVSFTLASIACALAQDIWTFLICRMLQAGMAAGYALSLAIVRDTNSDKQAAGLIGYISMSMAIAPMLGPMLGGVLDTAFGWRSNFYFYALSGICLFVLCWFDLGETRPAKTVGEPDQQISTLLKLPLFWAFAICTAFSTGGFFIFLTGAPLVAKSVFGVSSAELGFYIGTITAGFMLGSFLSGRFAPRFEITTMMIAGRTVSCVGLLTGLVLLQLGYVSPLLYFGSTIFVGLGNGLTMPNSNAGALSVRPKLAGSAAGISGALTVGIGALLTSLTGVIVPEENGGSTLLVLILIASVIGLVCSIYAANLRRKTPDAV